jgi:NAD(P)-dependent dehydrogenase (short-subunit alcohol dehydrogenase family)
MINTKGIYLMTKARCRRSSSHAMVDRQHRLDRGRRVIGMVAYCGSKFAAISITQALAAELAPDNIRVNAICPHGRHCDVARTSMPMNTLDQNAKTANSNAR